MSDTYEFDAMISVTAKSKKVAADIVLERCLEANIAISLHEEGTLNVRRQSAENRDRGLIIDQLKAALHEAYRDSFYGDSERQELVAFHCLLDDDPVSTEQTCTQNGNKDTRQDFNEPCPYCEKGRV